MDYRHMDDIVRELEQAFGDKGDDYDHLVLAGASLGVVQADYPEWGATFWKHFEIAAKLHPTIHTVVLLEHEDCGAYKVFYGESYDPSLHAATSKVLEARIRRAAPHLEVRRMIMRRAPQQAGKWRIADLRLQT